METEKAGVETDELGSELDEGVETDESVSSADSEDNTDWKAIAEREIEKNENLKKALDQKRQLRKHATTSSDVVDDSNEDNEDKPLTQKDFERLMQEMVMPVVAGNKVDTILADRIKDPDKRQLVKLYYDTRIRQTGTSDEAIREDIDSAIAIADRYKANKLAGEIKRVVNKDTTPSLNGSSADRGGDQKGHKFTAEQVKALETQARRINADPKIFIEKAWQNTRRG